MAADRINDVIFAAVFFVFLNILFDLHFRYILCPDFVYSKTGCLPVIPRSFKRDLRQQNAWCFRFYENNTLPFSCNLALGNKARFPPTK